VVEYEDSARTGKRLTGIPGFANTFQLSVTEGLVNTLGAIVMQTLKTVLSYSLETYADKPSGFIANSQESSDLARPLSNE